MDDNEPLRALIIIYKQEGFPGKEAVEKAERELQRRREHEVHMKDTKREYRISVRHHSLVPLNTSFHLFFSLMFYSYYLNRQMRPLHSVLEFHCWTFFHKLAAILQLCYRPNPSTATFLHVLLELHH